MSITFRCLECAETYELDDDMAGKTIRCRECHGFNRVPFAERKIASSPAPSVPNIQKPFSRFTFRHGLFAGIGLASVLGAAGLWLGLQDHTKPKPPTPSPRLADNIRPASQPPSPSPLQPPQPRVNDHAGQEKQRQEAARAAAIQRQKENDERQRRAAMEAEQARLQQAIEAEKERQRKAEREFALMSPHELQLAANISRKIEKRENLLSSEVKFMRSHWVAFDAPATRQNIRKTVSGFGMEEVCDNLGIAENKRTNYVVESVFYLIAINKGYMGVFTMRAISRIIKTAGTAGLPTPYKKFIRENPGLFPGIAP